MIESYSDYKEYLLADISRTREVFYSEFKMFVELLKGNVRAYKKYRFLKALRWMEFCENCLKNGGVISKIRYLLAKHKFQRMQFETQIFIHPNCFGKGLNLEHPGFQWVDEASVVGINCTILPRVLLGRKNPSVKIPCIYIGDNCYIGSGTTILGPVTIGDNVIIAAGSVVINDVPDNCMVAGNPAVVKKMGVEAIQV